MLELTICMAAVRAQSMTHPDGGVHAAVHGRVRVMLLVQTGSLPSRSGTCEIYVAVLDLASIDCKQLLLRRRSQVHSFSEGFVPLMPGLSAVGGLWGLSPSSKQWVAAAAAVGPSRKGHRWCRNVCIEA